MLPVDDDDDNNDDDDGDDGKTASDRDPDFSCLVCGSSVCLSLCVPRKLMILFITCLAICNSSCVLFSIFC